MRYLVWNALLPVDTVTVLRACSQCVLLAFCTFFVSYHKEFWNKYIFLPKDCMKEQCLLVLTFRLLIVACFSYLVSVQICEIVTVSSLCPSRNWRDVVLSTLCSALGTRVSRRICVSASTILSSTLSKLYSRDLKSLKWMFRIIFEYFDILNTKMCPSLQVYRFYVLCIKVNL